MSWPPVATVAALSGCAVYGRTSDPPPLPSDSDGIGGANAVRLVATDAVPVGGGIINDELGVVVTQPTTGEFRAFSARCTHQGCSVSEVTDGLIHCFCHGSQFAITDGAVVRAAQGLTPDQQDPLPEVGIAIDGDTVTLP